MSEVQGYRCRLLLTLSNSIYFLSYTSLMICDTNRNLTSLSYIPWCLVICGLKNACVFCCLRYVGSFWCNVIHKVNIWEISWVKNTEAWVAMKEEHERTPLRTILQNFLNHIESLEIQRIEDSYEKEFQVLLLFRRKSQNFCSTNPH